MSGGAAINYAYFRQYVLSLPEASRLRVLDYGCGSGGSRQPPAGLRD